jgi:hypothetical protein
MRVFKMLGREPAGEMAETHTRNREA